MSNIDNSGAPSSQSDPSKWERDLLNKMVMSIVEEKKRSRHWGIFFKLLTFAYLTALLIVLVWSEDFDVSQSVLKEHTALIDVDGVIGPQEQASADRIVTGLRNAFKDKKTKGVILRMNTPGGSPVQSRYVNQEITRLKKKYPDIPVYTVVVDMCASGGYYIASATDQIYADEGSIVGSIGVLMNGFGFVDALESLGIERRLMTAGENKAIMDPFSPLKESDRIHVQNLLDQLHTQFIDTVKTGRGERLNVDEYPEVFSGLFWSGEEAKKIGLIDDFGSSSYVAREVIGVKDIVDFTKKEDVWERVAERLGTGAAEALARITGIGPDYKLR
jgi:protease-4